MFNQIGGLNAIGAPLSPNRIGGENIYYTKWSGLGMSVFSEYDESYYDTIIANGFVNLRMDIPDYERTASIIISKASVIVAVGKGANVTWGLSAGDTTITDTNWENFRTASKAAAQWSQDNGVFEFQIGNELERVIDGTTMTLANLITHLKALATEVQAIFTNGNISYSCFHENWDDWTAAGKGDIDLIALNCYMVFDPQNYPAPWKAEIDGLIAAFGAGGTYITEFSPSSDGIEVYSADEAVQAAGVTEMIDYIKASGMLRANFYMWHDNEYGTFGVVKDAPNEGVYRKLWVSLLGSQLAVGQNKLIDKWRANN